MSSPNGYATLVQNRGDIVRMQVLDVEGNHTAAFVGFWPVQLDIGGLAHLLQGITDQEMLVGLYRFHAQPLQILDRGCQADTLGNRGCTSLKFPGEIIPTGPLKSYFTDHVATVEERLHLLQEAAFAIQTANAGRTQHFMARKGKKITIYSAHINGHVGNALGAVHTQ